MSSGDSKGEKKVMGLKLEPGDLGYLLVKAFNKCN